MRPAAVQPTPHTETSLLHRIVAGWNRFWFTPGDPLPLGAIRICAGLVFLYVHACYSVDLQALLGPNAWLDLQTFNKFRENTPWIAQPLTNDRKGFDEPRFQLPGETAESRLWLAQWLADHKVKSKEDLQRLKQQGVEIPREKELDYLADWGWDPNQPEVVGRGNWVYTPWAHVTNPAWMVTLHAAFLVVLFLFTIGFCTRVTSVLTWIGILGYIQRTPTTVFGMDTMMNILALYLMIGPSGATLSVDRVLSHYWSRRRSARGPARTLDLLHAPPQISANLALRLMQVHVCFVYVASGLSKLEGGSWWNGTATWYTMANPEFSPLRFQVYMDMIQFLAEHPWLCYITMNLGSAFTLFFETSFPYLVWLRRTRWVVLGMALVMHTGIAIFMGLATFSLMMLPMLLSFVPPEALHRFLERAGERFSRTYPEPRLAAG